MPGGDGSGPNGMGPMTGRGAGYCSGNSVPGFATGFGARGMGAGFARGGGRGRRNQFYATGLPGFVRGGFAPPMGTYSPASGSDEITILKNQAQAFQGALERITQRLDELKGNEGV